MKILGPQNVNLCFLFQVCLKAEQMSFQTIRLLFLLYQSHRLNECDSMILLFKALMVKRDGVWIEWTYKRYYDEARSVAKAFISLLLERHCSVGILGYNSPEWFISQMGAILAGGISTGIYTTNRYHSYASLIITHVAC
jgi:long-subunit acyl-CoA synthetase (AMP-forming)